MTVRVVCPSCQAVYNVPEERVTSDVVRATCKVCGNDIEIRRDQAGNADPPAPSTPVPPIPHAEDEKPTGTWQKAILDNSETDRLLGVDSTTLPPGGPEGTVDEPTLDEPTNRQAPAATDLGNQVIASRQDLERVFPDADPEPPPSVASPPPTQGAKAEPRPRKKRRRGGRLMGVLRIFVFIVAILAVIGAALVVGKMFEII